MTYVLLIPEHIPGIINATADHLMDRSATAGKNMISFLLPNILIAVINLFKFKGFIMLLCRKVFPKLDLLSKYLNLVRKLQMANS